MKKILAISILAFAAVFASVTVTSAFTSPYPASYTSWTAGNTITSAWLNTIEQMIGTGSTSTSLTQQIANVSSSVGDKVASINGIATSAVNFAASGSGLSVASSGNTITYSYSSSTLNLGTISSFASTDYRTSSTPTVSSLLV